MSSNPNSISCKICQAPSRLYQPNLSDDRYGYPGVFSVYRCTRCHFGQLQPTIPSDQLEDLYTNYYPRKHVSVASVQAGQEHQDRWLMGSPSIYLRYAATGLRMLDIGCGDGASLLTMQARGAEAYGTEFDHNVLAPAQALGLNIYIGNLDAAPFPDHYFDVITLNQLLEHIEDPIQFLEQIKKKLKPGGKIIITTPRFAGLSQHLTGRRWINWHIPFHVNFFSHASLERLASQTKLQLAKLSTFTPHTWVILQILNLKQPNPYWHPRPAGLSVFTYLRQLGILRASHLLFAHAFGWLSIPAYRLVDSLHGGDSWLIVLVA